MRVLFLTQRLPYAPNRGDRIRAYYLLQEMSRFADVSLFSLIHDDDETAQAAHVPFAHDVTTARVTRARNFLLGAARLASRRPLTHSLLDAPSAHSALAGLANASPPDVVVAFCSSMARFAMESPLNRFPMVLDMVDVDSAKWTQLGNEARGPRRWLYRREASTLGAFEARAAERARMTLVVNERERLELRRVAPHARMCVVENGIDVDAFVPPDAPGTDPIVVFCGVLNYYPNEEGLRWFAQDVWPRIRAVRADARFLIIGSGATRSVTDLGARDASIEVVGRVPAVQPYLWKSAVSVAPLRLARGLQNKVLEAIAAGLPVVVTPAVWSGLPPEAHTACVSAEHASDFASAVLALLEQSPAARRRLAATAPLGGLKWRARLGAIEGILRDAQDHA